MLDRVKVTSRLGYTAEEIYQDSILNSLGGSDLLELMIEARDFQPIYYNRQGLQFTYTSPEEWAPVNRAKFIPMAAFEDGLQYFAPTIYQLRLVIEARLGDRWEMRKAYHVVTLSDPRRIVKTFEAVTGLTIGFL